MGWHEIIGEFGGWVVKGGNVEFDGRDSNKPPG